MNKINPRDFLLGLLTVVVISLLIYQVSIGSNYRNEQLTSRSEKFVDYVVADNYLMDDPAMDDLMINDSAGSTGVSNVATVYGPYVSKGVSSNGDTNIVTTTSEKSRVAAPGTYAKSKIVPIWENEQTDIYSASLKSKTLKVAFKHNQNFNEYALPLKVIWVYSNKTLVGDKVDKSWAYVVVDEFALSADGKTAVSTRYFDGYHKPEYKTNPKYKYEDVDSLIASIKSDPAGAFNRFVSGAEYKVVTDKTRIGQVGWAWRNTSNVNQYYYRNNSSEPWAVSSMR